MLVQQKKFVAVLFWLFFAVSANMYAQQVVLTDNFEDQDLTQNPVWSGDTGDFTFFDDGGNTQLRLDADGAGSTTISTQSSVVYGAWEFFIHQDFSPSNSNRGYIFLMSDIADLNGNVTGYAIRTGESGSDDRFRLYRFT